MEGPEDWGERGLSLGCVQPLGRCDLDLLLLWTKQHPHPSTSSQPRPQQKGSPQCPQQPGGQREDRGRYEFSRAVWTLQPY